VGRQRRAFAARSRASSARAALAIDQAPGGEQVDLHAELITADVAHELALARSALQRHPAAAARLTRLGASTRPAEVAAMTIRGHTTTKSYHLPMKLGVTSTPISDPLMGSTTRRRAVDVADGWVEQRIRRAVAVGPRTWAGGGCRVTRIQRFALGAA
jgi:hypothetical protein